MVSANINRVEMKTTSQLADVADEALACHVFLVDDSSICRQVIKKILLSAQMIVEEFSSAQALLDRTAEVLPDVILTDVQMPEIDGYQLCQKLKNQVRTQNVPVLFLTSQGDVEQKVHGFKCGGADYITKQANDAEVIARVCAHVRMARLQGEIIKSHNEIAHQIDVIQQHVEEEERLESQVALQEEQLRQAERMASIGQLAAGVAHEINNPMGFISSNLNSLQEYMANVKTLLSTYEGLSGEATLTPEQVRTVCDQAKARYAELDMAFILEDLDQLVGESIEGAERVRKIVADLRDFSHVDTPDAVQVQLNDLIEKTISVAANELKYKADVSHDYGALPEIACYSGKLSQVFLNLLVNAAQAIDGHGRIHIQTGVAGDKVWAEISDNGCGIPPENLKRIYDPFFTTKDVGEGTGLGLNMVFNIIKAHEGCVDVSSEVGKGTTFRLTLPINGPREVGIENIIGAEA